MDGVHDLGGMQGFGRVEREEDEPVFHARWEAEVWTMMRAAGGRGVFNIDEFRHAIERMRPAEYLAASYYEKWLGGITRLFLEKGVVTEAELTERIAFFEGTRMPPSPGRSPLRRRPLSRSIPDGRWTSSVRRGRARAFARRSCGHPQHPPARPHAAATLRARQARGDPPRARHSRLSRHPRARAGRAGAAALQRSLRGARAVGPGRGAAPVGAHRPLGKLLLAA